MGSRIFGIILFLTVSTALALPEKLKVQNNVKPQTDNGPIIGKAIEDLIAKMDDPLRIFPMEDDQQISIDLTVLGKSLGIPVKGNMNISSLSLAGQRGIKLTKSYLNYDNMASPIPMEFAITDSSLRLEVDCSVDALLLSIIPFHGKGILYVGVNDLELMLKGALKNGFGNLQFTTFDFSLEIAALAISVGKVLGDENADLAKTVDEILTRLLTEQILEPVMKLVKSPIGHKLLAASLQDTFNGLELTLADLVKIISPKLFQH